MEDRIGILWVKISKTGQTYLSGILEIEDKKTAIVVFKNYNKKSKDSPDYYVLEKVNSPEDNNKNLDIHEDET